MDSRREHSQPAGSDIWKALGWAGIAVVVVGVAAWAALPERRPSPYGVLERGDFWHPEWVLVATFVCYPIGYCAQRCWWLAVPLVTLVTAQFAYLAIGGVAVLHEARVATELDAGWYAVGAAQIVLCLGAAIRGARRNVVHRRWVRSMQALLPDLAADPEREWQKGFFSTG